MDNEKTYYFLKDVDCPSSLTKMEKLVTEHLRRYRGHVISSARLDGIVADLNKAQEEIISTNKRLKGVDIRLSDIYLAQARWLYIGSNCITMIKVEGFDD